jgi:hypothetical protein
MTVSERNGDRSRFNRERKAKLALRARNRKLRETLKKATPEAAAKK